jgi:RluA family pseudouridine synthase
VEHSGLNLRQALKLFTGLSSKQVKAAIDSRRVRVDGRVEQHGSTKLRVGQRLIWEAPTLAHPAPRSDRADFKVEVLFKNDHYLVVDKPPGIPSQRTKDPRRPTVEGKVLDWCRNRGVLEVSLAHRLDRDTSGVLVFGIGKGATESLMKWFKHRMIQKTYYALTKGVAPKGSGVWETHQGRVSSRGGRQVFGSVRSGGQSAVTGYRVLGSRAGHSLWELKPKTGRTHQLRVHLSEAGFPIVGDHLYGRRDDCDVEPHHLLHAGCLALPICAGEYRWQSDLPLNFRAALDKVGLDSKTE